jgi:hypothetical protein
MGAAGGAKRLREVERLYSRRKRIRDTDRGFVPSN